MSVEFYTEAQAWPIGLPIEPPTARPLEARRSDGTVVSRWEYAGDSWVRVGDPVRWHRCWAEVVFLCLSRGWTLRSLPGGDG
jgi:hypothetical protein